jgi:cell division protein FtsL
MNTGTKAFGIAVIIVIVLVIIGFIVVSYVSFENRPKVQTLEPKVIIAENKINEKINWYNTYFISEATKDAYIAEACKDLNDPNRLRTSLEFHSCSRELRKEFI